MTGKIPVAAVVGATASGKTGLAVFLAETFGGEVVSCDSMQIYRGMPIATAQPTEAEMRGVPHYLIGFLDPAETYSAARYCRDAAAVIRDVYGRGRLPIVCGGTGLYADALLRGVTFAEVPSDDALRAQLNERFAREGGDALLRELRAVDPESAAKLHPADGKRIVRALEVYRLTGQTISHFNAVSHDRPSEYDVLWLETSWPDRQALYDRIDRRVDAMLDAGLAREARAFYAANPGGTAKAAIGYKELKPWLDGEKSFEAAVADLKTATRRYAKRQLTWFRRHDDIIRLRCDAPDAAQQAAQCVRARFFPQDA